MDMDMMIKEEYIGKILKLFDSNEYIYNYCQPLLGLAELKCDIAQDTIKRDLEYRLRQEELSFVMDIYDGMSAIVDFSSDDDIFDETLIGI